MPFTTRQPLQLERPVGAHADTCELEYVCCLHQTTPLTTIQAQDICLLLRSKYGVNVEEAHVLSMMFDLGANSNEESNSAASTSQSQSPSSISSIIRSSKRADNNKTSYYYDKNNNNNEEEEEKELKEYNANKTDQYDNKKSSLDICQIMSLILAPHLVKQSSFGDMEEVQQVFGVIFEKVLLDAGIEEGATIDIQLIQKIVGAYKEVDNISPEDMKAMVECISSTTTTSSSLFTLDAFRCALVSDLQLLNVGAGELATTHWQDVWDDDTKSQQHRRMPVRPQDMHQEAARYGHGYGYGCSSRPHTHGASVVVVASKTTNPLNPFGDEDDEEDKELIPGESSNGQHQLLREEERIPTLSNIDRVAESYPSQFFAVVVMVMVVVIYFSYLFNFDIGFQAVDCDNYASELLCQISIGMVNWLLVMLQLVVFGVPFTILVSMGMSLFYYVGSKKDDMKIPLLELAAGVTSVIVIMILSLYFPIHAALLNVDKEEVESLNLWSHVTSLALGSMLLCFQFLQFLRIVTKLPSKSSKIVKWLLTPRITYKEMHSKQAATYKSQLVIDNALELHEDGQPSAVALSNYFEHGLFDKTETIGTTGWFWWHGIRKGWLTRREGVWFHTRILSSNLVQLFVIAGLIAAMTAGVTYVNEYYDGQEGVTTTATGSGSSSEKAPPSEWSLYIPGDINPVFVTYMDWRYIHPLDQAAFKQDELTIIQGRYNVQPLHLPNTLGTWYMNSKALYFYNNPSSDLIESRRLIPYLEPLPDLAVLNVIHDSTAFNSNSFSPGQQVLAMVPSGLCGQEEDNQQPFNAGLYQECVSNSTAWVDDGLRELSDNRWTLDDSVRLAASSQDLLVATAIESLVDTIERPEAIAGIIAGGVAGILAVLATSIMYIPSYIICVLKFRSGIFPVDKYFRRTYRTNTEDASVLFGGALWGCALSAGISALFIGSIAFLTGWEQSRTFMLAIFGHMIGWALTVGIKLLFLALIRGLYVKALYRDRPGASNVVNLALECWHIGLAAGYMVIQAIFLLARTTIAIGHADTALPQAFRKDVVISEAHRHAYIQRLAVLYLTKLRYGSKFSTRSGSCWRLIYVLALMPWLKKHRPGFENFDMITTTKLKDDNDDVAARLEQDNANLRSDNDRLIGERDRYAAQVKNSNGFPMLSSSTHRTSPTSTESEDWPESPMSLLPPESQHAEFLPLSGKQHTGALNNPSSEKFKRAGSGDSDLAIPANSTESNGAPDADSEMVVENEHEEAAVFHQASGGASTDSKRYPKEDSNSRHSVSTGIATSMEADSDAPQFEAES